MMKLENLQRVDRKAQSAGRADLPVVITRQCYGLALLLDKVHRREMKGVERSDRLGKGSKARAKTGKESSTSAIRPNKVRTSSPWERASLRAWMRVQISYSISRLEIKVSCQSASGGTRSSARRCASATDVSR